MKAAFRIVALTAALALTLLAPVQVQGSGYYYCVYQCDDGTYQHVWKASHEPCCGIGYTCPSGWIAYPYYFYGPRTPLTECVEGPINP